MNERRQTGRLRSRWAWKLVLYVLATALLHVFVKLNVERRHDGSLHHPTNYSAQSASGSHHKVIL